MLHTFGTLCAVIYFSSPQHEELYNLMLDLAISAGACVSYNTPITSVSTDDGRPSVTLQDGSHHQADVVIGADGPQSLIREFVNGEQDDPTESGQSFLTYVSSLPDNQLDPHPPVFSLQNYPPFEQTEK